MLDDDLLWVLIGVLIVFPIVATFAMNRLFRRRGGVVRGWGGALLITVCWIVALAAIYGKVQD